MFRKVMSGLLMLAIAIGLLLAAGSARAVEYSTNGDFENADVWLGWEVVPGKTNPFTAQTGVDAIGGSGTSAYAAEGDDAYVQSWPLGVPGNAELSYDFAMEGSNETFAISAGTIFPDYSEWVFRVLDGSPGRGSWAISAAPWPNTWTVLLEDAVIYDDNVQETPLVHNFLLKTYDFGGPNPSYDIQITDSDGAVHSATGLKNWGHHGPTHPPLGGINQLTFQQAYWVPREDYLIDNVSIIAGEPPLAYEVPLEQRQLFLDDHGVALLDGLQKTMHQPIKKGAVIVPDQPWEIVLQTRAAPAWDEQAGVYKLWLITSTNISGVAGTSYTESTDGIHWTKPVLRQYRLQGSLENNFINVGPTQLEWHYNAILGVVYDPDDPNPNRRYKGFLGAVGRKPMVSPDGTHWTLLGVPELPSADESNLSYDRDSGMFIATLKTGGPYGRSQGIWTSTDFDNWTNTGVVFSADALDQTLAVTNIQARLADPTLQQPIYNNPADYNADIYNMGIFKYEGLYIGLPAVYHATGNLPTANTDGFHLIQLAASRDLRTWQRLGDRQTFIGPSPVGEGVYDLTQLTTPSSPVVRGDELWFYYAGIKYRATPDNPEPYGAISLAVLRRDGFMSLDAGAELGTVVTKPFELTGPELFVNADATNGSLAVDVLNSDGELLASSATIVGDQLHTRMEWESGDLASLVGQTVVLRISLQNASLYSFWVVPEPTTAVMLLIGTLTMAAVSCRRRPGTRGRAMEIG
jgi:hypothetical protein